MHNHLIKIVESLGRPKILVVGDVMLDRYVFGDAERISPEAPVQVLRVVSEEHRLGGAGSVASDLIALGSRASVCGAVGRDTDGERALKMLRSAGAQAAGVLQQKGAPTTVRTRFVGRAQHRIPQQVLRVDRGRDAAVDGASEDRILKAVEKSIRAASCVILSDYDGGTVTPKVSRGVIALARRAKKPVLVDPYKSSDYAKYRGASLLALNSMEVALACGIPAGDAAAVRKAAHRLAADLHVAALVITMGKDGALIIEKGKPARTVPTRPRLIFDNAGAGDMFVSTLAVVLSEGNSLLDAVRLANVAGGLEVEKFGVQTVSREEIIHDLLEESRHMGGKELGLAALLANVARHRMLGQSIVFTNGCFDLIHQGHIQLLDFAGSLGDVLIVGLNSDHSVRMNKGEGRPFCSQKERSKVLSGLEAVDYVVAFDTKTPIPLLKAIQPDILVKGGDYGLDGVVGRPIVESYGGRVVLAPLAKGRSTTELVQRIQANGNGNQSSGRAKGRARPGRTQKRKRRKSK
jgi:D-beta-D-heptose 7-phosphate kinase/D-beta-D-heptose 1-phosphate adenosyltransferase